MPRRCILPKSICDQCASGYDQARHRTACYRRDGCRWHALSWAALLPGYAYNVRYECPQLRSITSSQNTRVCVRVCVRVDLSVNVYVRSLCDTNSFQSRRAIRKLRVDITACHTTDTYKHIWVMLIVCSRTASCGVQLSLRGPRDANSNATHQIWFVQKHSCVRRRTWAYASNGTVGVPRRPSAFFFGHK